MENTEQELYPVVNTSFIIGDEIYEKASRLVLLYVIGTITHLPKTIGGIRHVSATVSRTGIRIGHTIRKS